MGDGSAFGLALPIFLILWLGLVVGLMFGFKPSRSTAIIGALSAMALPLAVLLGIFLAA